MTTKFHSCTRLGDRVVWKGDNFDTLHEAMASLDASDVRRGSIYIVEVITTKVWDSAKSKKARTSKRGAMERIVEKIIT